MEDVSNTLQQMQEKEENLTEDIINLKNEMCTKLDTKATNGHYWTSIVSVNTWFSKVALLWQYLAGTLVASKAFLKNM